VYTASAGDSSGLLLEAVAPSAPPPLHPNPHQLRGSPRRASSSLPSAGGASRATSAPLWRDHTPLEQSEFERMRGACCRGCRGAAAAGGRASVRCVPCTTALGCSAQPPRPSLCGRARPLARRATARALNFKPPNSANKRGRNGLSLSMLSRRPIQLPPPGRNDCGSGGRRGTIPYHTIPTHSLRTRPTA
jgi:hypothetical protein